MKTTVFVSHLLVLQTKSFISTDIIANISLAKTIDKMFCYYSPTSISSNVFDSLWDFSTTFRRRCNLLFQFRLQIFRRRVGIFSHFFLCCFYFLWRIMLIFLQFSIGTRAVVRSSRHRPFCFHNFFVKLFCLGLSHVTLLLACCKHDGDRHILGHLCTYVLAIFDFVLWLRPAVSSLSNVRTVDPHILFRI